MSEKKEWLVYRAEEKVSLVILTPDEAEPLCRMFNQKELAEFIPSSQPMYPAAERKYLEELPERKPTYLFGIVRNDTKKLIGTVGLHQVDQKHRTATIGMMIGSQDDREQGFGARAGALLLDFAFNELNLRKLRAEAFAHNKRSQALIRKLGGQEEGIFRQQFFVNGRYVDAVSFSIFRPGAAEPKP